MIKYLRKRYAEVVRKKILAVETAPLTISLRWGTGVFTPQPNVALEKAQHGAAQALALASRFMWLWYGDLRQVPKGYHLYYEGKAKLSQQLKHNDSRQPEAARLAREAAGL